MQLMIGFSVAKRERHAALYVVVCINTTEKPDCRHPPVLIAWGAAQVLKRGYHSRNRTRQHIFQNPSAAQSRPLGPAEPGSDHGGQPQQREQRSLRARRAGRPIPCFGEHPGLGHVGGAVGGNTTHTVGE